MNRFLSLAVLVLTLGMSGCTTGAVYEGARNMQRNQCLSLPESERQACLERIQDDYETYKRKREAIAGSSSYQ
jgi:hypothetical protein